MASKIFGVLNSHRKTEGRGINDYDKTKETEYIQK